MISAILKRSQMFSYCSQDVRGIFSDILRILAEILRHPQIFSDNLSYAQHILGLFADVLRHSQIFSEHPQIILEDIF